MSGVDVCTHSCHARAYTTNTNKSYSVSSIHCIHLTSIPDKYRMSFPSASSFFTTNSAYREDSTDTDSSSRSPRLPRKECYLFTELMPSSNFRKSSSLGMRTKESEEGDWLMVLPISQIVTVLWFWCYLTREHLLLVLFCHLAVLYYYDDFLLVAAVMILSSLIHKRSDCGD